MKVTAARFFPSADRPRRLFQRRTLLSARRFFMDLQNRNCGGGEARQDIQRYVQPGKERRRDDADTKEKAWSRDVQTSFGKTELLQAAVFRGSVCFRTLRA